MSQPASELALLFIHGFNSGGGSNKATFLRDNLPETEVISPTLAFTPMHAIAQLAELIEERLDNQQAVALVGSSLGGFYAAYLASRFALPFVMINPLVDQTLLRHEIGPQQNFYSGERYQWTASHCEQLDEMTIAPASLPIKPLLLLDAADELLDSELASRHFGAHAETHIFPGGNHRFAHMPEALPLIRAYLQRVIRAQV